MCLDLVFVAKLSVSKLIRLNLFAAIVTLQPITKNISDFVAELLHLVAHQVAAPSLYSIFPANLILVYLRLFDTFLIATCLCPSVLALVHHLLLQAPLPPTILDVLILTSILQQNSALLAELKIQSN